MLGASGGGGGRVAAGGGGNSSESSRSEDEAMDRMCSTDLRARLTRLPRGSSVLLIPFRSLAQGASVDDDDDDNDNDNDANSAAPARASAPSRRARTRKQKQRRSTRALHALPRARTRVHANVVFATPIDQLMPELAQAVADTKPPGPAPTNASTTAATAATSPCIPPVVLPKLFPTAPDVQRVYTQSLYAITMLAYTPLPSTLSSFSRSPIDYASAAAASSSSSSSAGGAPDASASILSTSTASMPATGPTSTSATTSTTTTPSAPPTLAAAPHRPARYTAPRFATLPTLTPFLHTATLLMRATFLTQVQQHEQMRVLNHLDSERLDDAYRAQLAQVQLTALLAEPRVSASTQHAQDLNTTLLHVANAIQMLQREQRRELRDELSCWQRLCGSSTWRTMSRDVAHRIVSIRSSAMQQLSAGDSGTTHDDLQRDYMLLLVLLAFPHLSTRTSLAAFSEIAFPIDDVMRFEADVCHEIPTEAYNMLHALALLRGISPLDHTVIYAYLLLLRPSTSVWFISTLDSIFSTIALLSNLYSWSSKLLQLYQFVLQRARWWCGALFTVYPFLMHDVAQQMLRHGEGGGGGVHTSVSHAKPRAVGVANGDAEAPAAASAQPSDPNHGHNGVTSQHSADANAAAAAHTLRRPHPRSTVRLKIPSDAASPADAHPVGVDPNDVDVAADDGMLSDGRLAYVLPIETSARSATSSPTSPVFRTTTPSDVLQLLLNSLYHCERTLHPDVAFGDTIAHEFSAGTLYRFAYLVATVTTRPLPTPLSLLRLLHPTTHETTARAFTAELAQLNQLPTRAQLLALLDVLERDLSYERRLFVSYGAAISTANATAAVLEFTDRAFTQYLDQLVAYASVHVPHMIANMLVDAEKHRSSAALGASSRVGLPPLTVSTDPNDSLGADMTDASLPSPSAMSHAESILAAAGADAVAMAAAHAAIATPLLAAMVGAMDSAASLSLDAHVPSHPPRLELKRSISAHSAALRAQVEEFPPSADVIAMLDVYRSIVAFANRAGRGGADRTHISDKVQVRIDACVHAAREWFVPLIGVWLPRVCMRVEALAIDAPSVDAMCNAIQQCIDELQTCPVQDRHIDLFLESVFTCVDGVADRTCEEMRAPLVFDAAQDAQWTYSRVSVRAAPAAATQQHSPRSAPSPAPLLTTTEAMGRLERLVEFEQYVATSFKVTTRETFRDMRDWSMPPAAFAASELLYTETDRVLPQGTVQQLCALVSSRPLDSRWSVAFATLKCEPTLHAWHDRIRAMLPKSSVAGSAAASASVAVLPVWIHVLTLRGVRRVVEELASVLAERAAQSHVVQVLRAHAMIVACLRWVRTHAALPAYIVQCRVGLARAAAAATATGQPSESGAVAAAEHAHAHEHEHKQEEKKQAPVLLVTRLAHALGLADADEWVPEGACECSECERVARGASSPKSPASPVLPAPRTLGAPRVQADAPAATSAAVRASSADSAAAGSSATTPPPSPWMRLIRREILQLQRAQWRCATALLPADTLRSLVSLTHAASAAGAAVSAAGAAVSPPSDSKWVLPALVRAEVLEEPATNEWLETLRSFEVHDAMGAAATSVRLRASAPPSIGGMSWFDMVAFGDDMAAAEAAAQAAEAKAAMEAAQAATDASATTAGSTASTITASTTLAADPHGSVQQHAHPSSYPPITSPHHHRALVARLCDANLPHDLTASILRGQPMLRNVAATAAPLTVTTTTTTSSGASPLPPTSTRRILAPPSPRPPSATALASPRTSAAGAGAAPVSPLSPAAAAPASPRPPPAAAAAP